MKSLGNVVIIIIWASISLAICFKGAVICNQSYQLDRTGIPARGVLVSKEQMSEDENHLDYRYLDEDHSYSGTTIVSKYDYDLAKIGTKVDIIYANADHSLSRLAGADQYPYGEQQIRAGLFLLGIGAAIAFAMFYPTLKRRRLIREGIQVRGNMVAIEIDNDSSCPCLRYRFTDATGLDHTGLTEGLNSAQSKYLEEKVDRKVTEIIVYYNPENPDDSTVILSPETTLLE